MSDFNNVSCRRAALDPLKRELKPLPMMLMSFDWGAEHC